MDKQVDSNILNLDIKPLNIVFIYLVFNYASISTGSFVDLVYNTTLLSSTGLNTPYNYTCYPLLLHDQTCIAFFVCFKVHTPVSMLVSIFILCV